MCARYTIRCRLAELANQWNVRLGPGMERFVPRYNIAPGQPVPVIADDGQGGLVLRLMRWGLVPHWANDPAIGSKLINARIETAREKPSFRDAFKYRRCVIPADGFYEWVEGAGGKRQPYFIHRQDDVVMAFAGLWDHWQDEHGNEVETCVILTTAANDVVKPLHDRMPMIINPASANAWIASRSPDDAMAAMQPGRDETRLAAHPVHPRMNRPAVEEANCIEPYSPGLSEQLRLF